MDEPKGKMMRIATSMILSGIAIVPAHAAGISLTVTIPRLSVAEYHRPYIGAWIEKPGANTAQTLFIWYGVDMRSGEGAKWLNEVRTWWRKSGRALKLPADGVSGATRAPGEQKIAFTGDSPQLRGLAPGTYDLMIEASRELGGRELLKIPFQWPPKGAETLSAQGKTELGAVRLTLQP